MNLKSYWSFHLLVLTGLISCEESLEFPIEPAVSFEEVQWIQMPDVADSISLTFQFQDGDGDVGLSLDNDFVPYHPFDLILDAKDHVVKKGSDVQPPFYRLSPNGGRKFLSEKDIRPDFNERDYITIDSVLGTGTLLQDTLFIHRNLFNKNIYVTILKKIDGHFFSVNQSMCGSCSEVSGRLPEMDFQSNEKVQTGRLNFTFAADYMGEIAEEDTIKLRFFIFDRELHQSNIEESSELVLSEIKSHKGS